MSDLRDVVPVEPAVCVSTSLLSDFPAQRHQEADYHRQVTPLVDRQTQEVAGWPGLAIFTIVIADRVAVQFLRKSEARFGMPGITIKRLLADKGATLHFCVFVAAYTALCSSPARQRCAGEPVCTKAVSR